MRVEPLTVAAATIHGELRAAIGLRLLPDGFGEVVARALDQTWTRDPFDRLICAHALVANCELATKDRSLRRHCPHAKWG